MSLDVYLHLSEPSTKHRTCIFVRENGSTREISRDEWDEKHPDRDPVVFHSEDEDGEVFSANITNNLSRMAKEAGIYKHMWRPDEIAISEASQLIEPLETGLSLLKSDRSKYEEFNPQNGWGDYDGLVAFVDSYLLACRDNPDAEIRVSR